MLEERQVVISHDAPKQYSPAGYPMQLAATVRRQFTQKRRMPLSMCIEIFLPVVFAVGIYLGSTADTVTTQPSEQFVTPNIPWDNNNPSMNRQQMLNDNSWVTNNYCYNGTNPRILAINYTFLKLCSSALNYTNPDPNNPNQNTGNKLWQCFNRGSGPNNNNVPNPDPNDPVICTDQFPAVMQLPFGFCIYKSCALQLGRGIGGGKQVALQIPFQQLVLAQWAAAMAYGPIMEIFGGNGGGEGLRNSGKIVLVPNNSITQALSKYLDDEFPLYEYVKGPFYESRDAAVEYSKTVAGEGKFWTIIEINSADPINGLSFVISLNKTSVPWTNRIRNRFGGGGIQSQDYQKYTSSGFIALQQEISKFFLRKVMNLPFSEVHTTASVPMGFASYRQSIFLKIAGQVLVPLFMVLSYLYPVSQLAKRIVEEKELRLREVVMVMGLGKSALLTSWIITYFIQGVITSAIITAVLKMVLKESQWSIIFILFLLFTLSTILLSCFLSSFFSKSRIVALVVPLFYFLLAIPSFALPDGTGKGTYLGLSVFSPTCFGIGVKLLFQYEVDKGFGWNDLNSTLDTVNMATVFGLLLFDCLLYIVLLAYLDEVLPSEWGTRKHPLFFLTCFCSGNKNSNEMYNREELHEECPPIKKVSKNQIVAVDKYPGDVMQQSVHLNHIRREFDSHGVVKVAVDDLEMRIFPDQVTVLLGHNGAGKTTAINLLTGMLELTSGNCYVYGKSLKDDLRGVRSEIGFCPQHNVLWTGLTCMEHLEYFARLKGVPSASIEHEAMDMLTKMDLLEKKDEFSDSLSGGQKRKLSVAIAMVGGSRLILLDEPTAGMDVGARRFTLNLLKTMAHGRTIVLTTHYMDEADALGNRVAIMSRGNLHSYGSPMYLKNMLGTGYVMRLSLDGSVRDVSPDVVLRVVNSVVPSAILKEAKGGNEIAVELPMDDAARFPAAIGLMESRSVQSQFGIAGISLSVSTLEDVFLRIAREEEGGAEQDDSQKASVEKLDEHYKAHSVARFPTFGRQLTGLLLKRLRYSKRDRRTIALQILLPLACIALAMILSKLGPPGSPPLRLDSSMYGGIPQEILLCNCTNIAGAFTGGVHPTAVQYPVQKPYNQTYTFSNAMVSDANAHGQAERNTALSCYDPDYDQFLNRTNNNGGNQGPPPPPINWTSLIVTFFNTSTLHSYPQSINEYYRGALNAAGTGNVNVPMSVYNFPLPFTNRQQTAVTSIQALLTGIFILIPFTFVPSTYVSYIVKEKQVKAKHLQLVSGVGHVCYWVSNFLFDLLSFTITMLMAFVIFFAFNRTEYIGSGTNIALTAVLFMLYGICSIPFAYGFSFLFEDHGAAQNLAMLGNFFCGFVFVLAHYVLKLIPTTVALANKIVWALRCFPAFCLGEGIITMAQAPSKQAISETVDLWDFESGVGYDLVYLAGGTIIFSLLTLLLEFLRRPSFEDVKALVDSNNTAAQENDSMHQLSKLFVNEEDDDVTKERALIESSDNTRRDDVLTAKHLNKVYPGGKIAVRDISFGVKKGEVFGFLGTNGAGKTTTMSILTSDARPTRGMATIFGYDVVQDEAEARKHIGFCPQFDALVDLLTAQEHLELYSALRGIPPDQTEVIVESLMQACALDRVSFAKNLSGGNKRKLSVAISLIGAPEVLLLDEPSAGMDPKARRQLWDVILIAVKHNSSVVLTTHHLEEVDALAHRVAIMVDGSLKCIGSVDHLKKKFGSGLEVMVKAQNEERIPQLKHFILSSFPTSVFLEECNMRVTYRIPTEGQPSLAHIFTVLQHAKESGALALEDYTVQQASLEQVFLRISGASEAAEEAAKVAGDNKKLGAVPNAQPQRVESAALISTSGGSMVGFGTYEAPLPTPTAVMQNVSTGSIIHTAFPAKRDDRAQPPQRKNPLPEYLL